MNPIDEFWRWFETESGEIRRAYGDSDSGWFKSFLTPRVKNLTSGLNWEIGPYSLPDDTFVLSPTVRENLVFTRACVSSAPSIAGWKFLHAKPSKNLLTLKFEVRGRHACADNWLYRLMVYNDGEFVDIELFAPRETPAPVGDEQLFGELVVESLLGEELRLDRVGHIVTHTLDSDATPDRASSIEHFIPHVADALRLGKSEG